MDKEQKVRFSADGNGLSEFMRKLQADAKKLYNDLRDEAKKAGVGDKQANDFIKERLRLLKEEYAFRQRMAQEEANRFKGNYTRASRAFGGDDPRAQYWEEKYRQAQQTVESIRQERVVAKEAGQQNGGNVGRSILRDIIAGNLISDVVKDVLKGLRGTANAQTGLDLLSPMASAAGAGIGAASGLFLLPSLAVAGKEAGGFAGAAYTRQIRTQEEYARAANTYGALTGGGLNLPSTSSMGFSGIDAITRAGSLAGSAGRRLSASDVISSLGLNRGFGISEGVIGEAFAGERTGGGSGTARMQRVLGVAIAEGLDRAKFTDAIKNQNQLLSQFAQTSTAVSDERINRILFEFNKMGGMFKVGDPRSMNLISSLNEGLGNPNGGFSQALSYSVLRNLPGNENTSIWNLIGQRQKGLQTPGYLKGVLNQFGKLGVSEDFQKMMFMGSSFGKGLSTDAIDTLFANKGNLENMSQEQLNKILTQGKIVGEANKFTNKLTRYEAETSDAFRESMMKGVTTISSQFEIEMKKAINEVSDYFSKRQTGTDKNIDVVAGNGILPHSVDAFASKYTLSLFQRIDQWLNWGPHKNQSKGK